MRAALALLLAACLPEGAPDLPPMPGAPEVGRMPESDTAFPTPAVQLTHQVVIEQDRVVAICTFVVLRDSTTIWLSPPPDPVLENGPCPELYRAWLERQALLGRRLKAR